ncbi:iron complex outermembrane receptor protein [Sphingomonas kaistensis]|uniref:Iron complex outermembrane receptor protein n=1 Tax=Sphingomonas kaistensis TaxID=298708 RepID=A0A7X5Y325_9SPHN|nr:TonB-dependent receptor [Sphingomonas kaistensis]NJC04273.1 iron complex outermembrane receptor protein [Sphingomonas kaistensis]
MTKSSSNGRYWLAASPLALCAALIATPASAQDVAAGPTDADAAAEISAQQDDTIVVTGLRASIRNAVNQKRNNSSIVEVIAAEDIGKLPDASIGEALSRLPGLTSQRFDGRSNKLSVRGLSPDFTTTTLNGREMVSSDSNRAVEFDQFPSELLNGAVVYKTPDAALTNQAIGGTIDLLTIRPLSQKRRTVAIGLRGEINDKGKLNRDTKDKGYRFNIALVDQNDAGTVGWALGYARMVQPIQEQWIQAWGYGNNVGGNAALEGIKPYVKSNELTRDGLAGTLEFIPVDNWQSRLDVFYSRFNDEQTLRGQEIAGYTASSFTPVTTADGLVTSGRWNGIRTQSRNDFTDRKVNTFAIGFNNVAQFTDRLRLELDASYSRADRKFTAAETYSSTGRGQTGLTDNITYTLGGPNGISVVSGLNYADPNLWRLGDNLGWGGPFCQEALGWQCASQDGYINREASSDDLAAIKLAASYELGGPISDIRVGARFASREKTQTKTGEFLTLNAYPAVLPIPANRLVEPADLGFLGLGPSIAYDVRQLIADGVYFRTPNDLLGSAKASWDVSEDIFNTYAMANIDADLGGMDLTGNAGVQLVHTDQSSAGNVVSFNTAGGLVITPRLDGDKYWDVLPSLNLSLGLARNHKLRLGAAKVLSRSRMDDMNASRDVNFIAANALSTDITRSPWTGGGGNPKLRPWRAWQFDASYEFYFGNGGYIAVAPYYKKLLNYVYTENVLTDFNGIIAPGPIQPILREGFISAPANGRGGRIYGLELSASLPFGSLVPALEGFGAIGSASFTNSKVRRTADAVPEELPGLSKRVLNGTLYFERAGFGARVSARHRSKFLAESFALGLTSELRFAKAETILDAQVSYDLTNVGFKGLSLYVQGSNLTDEPFVQYFGDDERRVRNYHTYGRNFMAGATWKF